MPGRLIAANGSLGKSLARGSLYGLLRLQVRSCSKEGKETTGSEAFLVFLRLL